MAIGGKESKGLDPPENKEAPDNFTGQEILKTFAQLTEKENPVIEVITTASSLAEESFSDYHTVFTELGVTTIHHIHHNNGKELLVDNLEQRVNQGDVFFFSGGDQLLLSSVYGGSFF